MQPHCVACQQAAPDHNDSVQNCDTISTKAHSDSIGWPDQRAITVVDAATGTRRAGGRH